MQTVRKLLQPDIAASEKYHIFLESVRYLRKSEQDASYNEILKQLSKLAQRVMKNGEELSDSAIQQYVQCYEVFLKEKKKYQVYLVGSLQSCEKVKLLLDYNRVHLLGWMKTVGEQIDQSDFCIVCDFLDEGTLNKIAGMQHTVMIRYDLIQYFVLGLLPECQELDIKFREKLKSKVEGVVLGLSYERKLNYRKLKHNLVCFAASSHDLFLDYHKLKWIYDEVVYKYGGDMKYCVLGMDFYRLWYDLSMSGYKRRMMCMYHKLHCVHHFHEFDAFLPKYEEDLKLCKELMIKDYMDQEYRRDYSVQEQPEINVYDPTEEEYQRDVSIIRDQVFHKPYLHTFRENIGKDFKVYEFTEYSGFSLYSAISGSV